jgi:hypothetical protein
LVNRMPVTDRDNSDRHTITWTDRKVIIAATSTADYHCLYLSITLSQRDSSYQST